MAEQPGRRRAPRRPWWRTLTSVPARLLMSGGLLVGFGAVGTSAYWSDEASLPAGSFTTGTFDLLIGPDVNALFLEGQGGEWTFPVVELADVGPGESAAKNIVFKNGGTTTLELTGVAQAATDDLSPRLLVTTRPDANAVVQSGTKQAVNRKGACTGGTANWWTDVAISTAPVNVIPSGGRLRLEAGEHRQVCMLVKFDAAAPSSMQGKTTTIQATFTAVQPEPAP